MSTLANINGTAVEVSHGLRVLWMEQPEFALPIIESVIMRQYAETIGAKVSDQELQVASEEMRYARGLESLQSLKQWMRENRQTPESIEYWLESLLLKSKLLAKITEDEIAASYAERRLDFERVGVYSCRVESEGKAEELMELIREGSSFSAIAMQHSTDMKTAPAGGLVGALSRSDVAPELEAVLFGAPVNEPIGPVKTEAGFNIFLVTEQMRPTLDEVRDVIRQELLAERLAKLARSATIEFPCLQS